MIHHVAVDVPAASLDDALAFWALLGFDEVPALRDGWRWVERGGTQLHLRARDGARPGGWHVAVLVDDYDGVVRALAAHGFSVEPGAPFDPAHPAGRGKTTAPGGVTVELMAAPPPRRPETR